MTPEGTSADAQSIDQEPILPCPFCGSSAFKVTQHIINEPYTWIQCASKACGAGAKPEAWNRRKTPDGTAGAAETFSALANRYNLKGHERADALRWFLLGQQSAQPATVDSKTAELIRALAAFVECNPQIFLAKGWDRLSLALHDHPLAHAAADSSGVSDG